MMGVGIMEILIVALVLIVPLVIVAGRMLSGGGSRGVGDQSQRAAPGVTLKCPSCGGETAANEPNCQHCAAEL